MFFPSPPPPLVVQCIHNYLVRSGKRNRESRHDFSFPCPIGIISVISTVFRSTDLMLSPSLVDNIVFNQHNLYFFYTYNRENKTLGIHSKWNNEYFSNKHKTYITECDEFCIKKSNDNVLL